MARRVESGDPDRLVYRVRPETPRVVGVVILLIGLGLMALSVPSVLRHEAREWPWFAMIVAAVGCLLAVVGLRAALRVPRLVIDRRQRVVTLPTLRKPKALSLFDRVIISRTMGYTIGWMGVRHGALYGICLEGAGAEKAEIAKNERDQAKVRQLAEEIARFAGLKLVDGSLGTQIVREAAEVGTTLRERTRAAAARAPLPEPPADRRSRSSVAGDTLVLDIPPRPLGRLLARTAAHVGLVLGAIIVILYLEGRPGEGDIVPICIGGGIGLAALLGVLLSVAVERSEVRISPRELRVTRRGLLRSRATAIPAGRLRDLEVGDDADRGSGVRRIYCRGPAIVARSDTESVVFGGGLSREELEWIKAVIESVVTA